MSWYNPFSWGQHDPEKYDPNNAQGINARTFERDDINHAYDVKANTATAANAGPASTTAGAQLATGDYNQVRGQQLGLADMLTAASRGEGPSGAGMAAQAQRDSSLSQAAALQAGRRGRSAVAGARMGTLGAQMGNQQASQNEAIGRANEMATARGQLGSTLGSLAGQDIGVAGQNAGLLQQSGMFNAGQLQQNNQFNAGMQQQTSLANMSAQNQAALANQAAQLGISTQELAARLHQGDMSFTNLDPGSKGYLAEIAGPAAAAATKWALAEHGTVAVPAYADGGVIGIGQRRTPVSKGDMDTGRGIANALMGVLAGYEQWKGDQQKKAEITQAKRDDQDKWREFLQSIQPAPQPAPLSAQYPQGQDNGTIPVSVPVTQPSQVPAYGKGGVSVPRDRTYDAPPMMRGPHPAIVGEAGPEAIVSLDRIVDRPTLTMLGHRPEAVIPLSPGKQDDRDRVTGLALALRGHLGPRGR